MAGRRCCSTENRRTRPPGRVRLWSIFTRPASMRPITNCGWEARAPICASPISWVATSRAWSARSARVSVTSPSVTRCWSRDQGIEGAYAEKIAIKAAIIAKKPDRLGHAEAAAMALTGLTALWALEIRPAQSWRNHSIQGGAGGVAGFGIQFAKHIGATVITTASAANHDYVRRLGADRVIDYNAENSTKTTSNCDVVFDTVGGAVQLRSYAVLKPGGRLVWIAAAPEGSQPPRSDVKVLRPGVARDRKHLERILELLESARYGRQTSSATRSPMRLRHTGSANRVTCRASSCLRCADPTSRCGSNLDVPSGVRALQENPRPIRERKRT